MEILPFVCAVIHVALECVRDLLSSTVSERDVEDKTIVVFGLLLRLADGVLKVLREQLNTSNISKLYFSIIDFLIVDQQLRVSFDQLKQSFDFFFAAVEVIDRESPDRDSRRA